MSLTGWLGGHPSYERLSRFSDGDLEARGARSVARHLETCSPCRREIQIMRDAEAALREVPIPRMPEDLFERAMARRASSVIPLLPLGPPSEPQPQPRGTLVAALGLVVIVTAAVVLLTARRVSADASVLDIDAIEGTTGASVRFQPSALLAGEDSVRLRAWAWGGRYDQFSPPQLFTAPLRKEGNEFRGRVTLDAGYDFAWMAVESWDGNRVDANGGEFSPLTRESRGHRSVASYAGELLALQDFANRGFPLWGELQSVVDEALVLFPDSPTLWFVKAAYDLRVTTSERARDSVEMVHGAKLSEFAARSEQSPEDLVALFNLALTLENEPQQRRLLDRLRRAAPDHPRIHERRVVDLVTDLSGDPTTLLGELEREWGIAGPANALLARSGFNIVKTFDDAEAVLRWAERGFAWNVAGRDGLLTEAAKLPAIRDWAIERLPAQIRFRQAPFDSERPIYQTRDSFQANSRRRAARLELALGNALLDRGQTAEATASLDRALTMTWDLETAERLISLLEHQAVRSGDSEPGLSARLVELRTLVAADPLHGSTQAPTPAVIQAGDDLFVRLTKGVRSGRLEPDAVQLGAPGEDPRALEPESTTVLASWYAMPPKAELAVLEDLSARLRDSDIALFLVSSERHFEEISARASQLGAQAFFEIDGTATEALGGWHASEYVVISGGQYWVLHDPQDAVRLALLVSSN